METCELEPSEPEVWQRLLSLSEQAEAAENGFEKWYGEAANDVLAEEGIAIRVRHSAFVM